MHKHTRLVHNMSLLEYIDQFGNPSDHIQDKVFHECAECSQLVFWEHNSIRQHMYRHKMTPGQYNQKFNIILGKVGPIPKKEKITQTFRIREDNRNYFQQLANSVKTEDQKPLSKYIPIIDVEDQRHSSIAASSIEDNNPLLVQEEQTKISVIVKQEKYGVEENVVQIGTLKKGYHIDGQDSELEEGELPQRSYFTSSETTG